MKAFDEIHQKELGSYGLQVKALDTPLTTDQGEAVKSALQRLDEHGTGAMGNYRKPFNWLSQSILGGERSAKAVEKFVKELNERS